MMRFSIVAPVLMMMWIFAVSTPFAASEAELHAPLLPVTAFCWGPLRRLPDSRHE
jgi:hypothetical protein